MASKIRTIIILLLMTAVAVVQVRGILGVDSANSKESPTIRVLVLKNIKSMDLSIQGGSSLIDEEHPAILEENPEGITSKVYLTPKGIWIHGREYITKKLAIEPEKDATIAVNNRRFRGHVTIMVTPNRTMNVINVVDLEQYTKGVLYHEISHRWPIEAIKAQAVATRSYAIYAIQQNKGKDYDVTNDIYSQVYGGKNSERFRTSLAVDGTKGLVLIYDEKILPAFFHATCAGMTENVAEVWNLTTPPLKGTLCPYCKISPHMRWKRNFRLRDVQEKLKAAGYDTGLIKEIKVVERNVSDRIKLLKIISRSGDIITISGKDFRNIIGPNDIRSNNYEVVMKGYYVDFYGHGWGHGVGLCQWGAYGMAQKQFSYKAILNHYYPGSEIEPFNDLEEED